MIGACPETHTDLTLVDASLILEPYYEAVREHFVEAGLADCEATELVVASWVHDKPRHFAACRDDGSEIIVAPALAEQDERIVLAIMSHELGHAADFLYPGEFTLGRNRAALRRRREEFNPDQWARWMRSWEDRETDVVEFTADAIAEEVMQVKIGYTGPCKLQCFNVGRRRPAGLR